MRLVKFNAASTPTPESVFTAKYEWLMRWALHFTQNDRHIAEDLVQETLVHLLVSWTRIKDDIEQVEAFLYSTLKYAHLNESRRARRFKFQDLSIIDFDDLGLSLREEKATDPIAVQDDLRRIVTYLCWRKRSAKSASVLLFRFFHGYFPEEISWLTLIGRGAVDELLRLAREEVKSWLADPSRVEIMRLGRPPEVMPKRMAVPPDQLAAELRSTIFQARTTACPDANQLLRAYQTLKPEPLSRAVLAHIVSCERCLAIFNSHFDLPSLTNRFSDGMVDSSRQSKKTPGLAPMELQDQIRRSIAGGKERFRKLYQHHPRALMIAVDGQVLAMRDISSPASELTVQAPADAPLRMINVLSEQGISLLKLFVPAKPPEAPPELHNEIALSDSRHLGLVLRFTSQGAVIELQYHDPFFTAYAAQPAGLDPDGELDDESLIMTPLATDSLVTEMLPVEGKGSLERRPWWTRFWRPVNFMPIVELNPMFATALACAFAAVIFLVLSFKSRAVMAPAELLDRAVASESASVSSGVQGIVAQSVRITTTHERIQRTLYRDVQRKRRPKRRSTSPQWTEVRSQLEALGIGWDNPLSAASFRDWHDHAPVQKDVVARTGDGLLTLTSSITTGTVASESLTVREADFHPISRSVELRNEGTVEVAEVEYNILPWNAVNSDSFEPDAGPRASSPEGRMHASYLSHLPSALTSIQLDEAELSARLVLNRLHLDANSRVELTRQPEGICVQGVVDTDEEKHQLQAQLRTVPHVIPFVLTVRELTASPPPGSEVTSIKQADTLSFQSSALERYLTAHNVERSAVGPAAQVLVDSVFTIKHESESIAGLLDRFTANEALPIDARTVLSELLIQHKTQLLEAIGKEEQQLVTLKLFTQPAILQAETEGNAAALRRNAEQNFSLCVEMLSTNGEPARSAETLSLQLSNNIAQLRSVVLHISDTAQMSTPPSSLKPANPQSN